MRDDGVRQLMIKDGRNSDMDTNTWTFVKRLIQKQRINSKSSQ